VVFDVVVLLAAAVVLDAAALLDADLLLDAPAVPPRAAVSSASKFALPTDRRSAYIGGRDSLFLRESAAITRTARTPCASRSVWSRASRAAGAPIDAEQRQGADV